MGVKLQVVLNSIQMMEIPILTTIILVEIFQLMVIVSKPTEIMSL